MKYDQVILEKNAYYEILNIKWRMSSLKFMENRRY